MGFTLTVLLLTFYNFFELMQNFNLLKYSKINNGITFKVKVIPNSSISKITEITEEFIKIKLNSPPIENRANKEVIVLLSKTFNVPKTSVELLNGDKNKLKIFYIPIEEKKFLEILEKC